jgi:electron transport complex protein RnfB
MDIWLIMLIAGGVLLVIGLALGVLICIAEKFLHVEEDPRIAEVEKMLPNVNCGACGHAGCHDMAEAIVSGEQQKLSDCKPGKKDKNFDPIIEYMKSHPDKDGKVHAPTI